MKESENPYTKTQSPADNDDIEHLRSVNGARQYLEQELQAQRFRRGLVLTAAIGLPFATTLCCILSQLPR